MEVVDHEVCLGITSGPEVDLSGQWQAPLEKFRRRGASIAAAGLPAARGFSAMARQIAPTLTYAGQLLPEPSGMDREDVRLRTKLFHVPFNFVPRAALMALELLGLVRQAPISHVLLAARERTALSTVPGWHEELRRLNIARRGGSLAALADPGRAGAGVWGGGPALSRTKFAEAEASFLARAGDGAQRERLRQAETGASLRGPCIRESLVSAMCARLWWESRSRMRASIEVPPPTRRGRGTGLRQAPCPNSR